MAGKKSGYFIIAFCLLLFHNTLIGQDAGKLSGAFLELKQAKTDSAKVEAYRDLCFNYSLVNPDSGIYYGKQGLDLATRINFKKGIGDSHNSLGWCYSNKGEFEKAKFHLLEAKTTFEAIGDKCFVAVSLANLGNMYYNQGLKAEALDYYIQSTNLNKNCPDKGFKASGIYSIGTIYNSTGEFEKAITYFREAYEINMANRDTNKAADCINGIGNALLGMQDYEKAIKHFEQSSKLYLSFNNFNGAAFANESIGLVYLEKKAYDLALKHFFVAKNHFVQLGHKPDIAFELYTIGSTYKSKGDYNAAISYLSEGIALANSNNLHSLRLQLYQALTDVYELKQDYLNAFKNFRIVSSIKDSLNKQNQQAKLDELLARLETEAKDRKIELLHKDNLIRESESAKQKQLKNLFLVTAVLLVILVYVLYNRYKLKKKLVSDLEITNLRIQHEKERAERSEKIKQQFLANMSHEIRTPLNAIVGILELLEEAPDEAMNNKYLDAVRNSSKNLNSIVNDILDLSKIESGKMQAEKVPVNLRILIENVARLFELKAKQKNLELKYSIAQNVPEWILSDPSKLTQILVNLTGNAIKFTEKGSVEIGVEINPESDSGGHPSVQIVISDTGIGIPLRDQEVIFDSFVQSGKSAGTGLGLTISKELASLLEGEITVSSTPGKGSAFTVRLPLVPSPGLISGDETGKSANKMNFSGMQILIVEDNEYNLLLFRGAIERKLKNVTIVAVSNGRSAIEYLHTCVKSGILPDVILMDIHMPGMNGFEVLDKIKKEFGPELGRVPVIAVTADVLQNNPVIFTEKGFSAVLSKPFRISDLIEKIITFTGERVETSSKSDIRKNGHSAGYDYHIINLRYLDDFTVGSTEEILKYIQIFKNRIPSILEVLKKTIESGDSQKSRSLMHGMKPMIESLGMEKCLRNMEMFFTETEPQNPELLLKFFNEIESDCMRALEELNDFERKNASTQISAI